MAIVGGDLTVSLAGQAGRYGGGRYSRCFRALLESVSLPYPKDFKSESDLMC